MIDKLQLGTVYDEKGKIINHRSLIKVLLNPFLRIIGIQIATIYDKEKNKLENPVIMKYGKITEFDYNLRDGCSIKKKRTFI